MTSNSRFIFKQDIESSLGDYYAVAQVIQQLKTNVPKQDLVAQEKLAQSWSNLPWLSFCDFVIGNNFSHSLKRYSTRESYSKTPKLTFQVSHPKAKLKIYYGVHPTLFGYCFLALADKYICQLSFVDHKTKIKNLAVQARQIAEKHTPGTKHNLINISSNKTKGKNLRSWTFAPSTDLALEDLRKTWPLASIMRSQEKTKKIVQKIFTQQNIKNTRKPEFSLLVQGSSLQVLVWKHLELLKKGKIASYSDLATFIQRPRAVRAVANCVAKNPISYLVPCHRIISKSAKTHAYRWGSTRKLAMLLRELA